MLHPCQPARRAFGPVAHRGQVRNQPFGGMRLRRQPRGFIGQFGQLRLDLAQRVGGFIGGLTGSILTRFMPLPGLVEFALLPSLTEKCLSIKKL